MAHKAGGCTPKEGVIDWSSRPVNRITEYAIVAKPRFTRNISPLFSYQDKLKIKAIQKQLERDEENGDL